MMSGIKRRCDDRLNSNLKEKTQMENTVRELNMVPVNSTMARSIGYEPDTETLFVEFQNGSVFQYPFVSANVWASLTTAPSVGRALQPIIKDANRDWIKVNVTNGVTIKHLDPFTS